MDWPTNIDTEKGRIVDMIEQLRKRALDMYDTDLLQEMDFADSLIASACDEWLHVANGKEYVPVAKDRIILAHKQGAITLNYGPTVSARQKGNHHNAP